MGARARRVMPMTWERPTVTMPAEGTLRLAMIADTHGHPHPESHRLVAAQRPHCILHGGDIGDLAVLDGFAEIAPVIAVRGNIDGHEGPCSSRERERGLVRASLKSEAPVAGTCTSPPDVQTIDVRDDDGSLVKLLLFHIALYGPKLRADAARMARSERASIVVCGHSHVPFIGRDQGIVVMNPGSIGPRRFQLPIVFGVMTVSRERIAMHHVSCETGERWEP